eukprot:354196-Chlamydomonas_euryale.AAC.12
MRNRNIHPRSDSSYSRNLTKSERYFLEPKAAVLKDGEETIKAATTEAEVCKKKMETLEKKLAETKKEMQELAKAS